MAKKKSFPLRIDPELHAVIENGQMMNFVASMHTSSIYFEKWQSKREIKKIKMHKNPADSSAGFLHINFSSSHAQLHDILYHFDKIDHHSQFYRFLYILYLLLLVNYLPYKQQIIHATVRYKVPMFHCCTCMENNHILQCI